MRQALYSFHISELDLKVEEIAAIMGYEDEIPEPIPEMIRAELDFFKVAVDLKGGYVIYDGEVHPTNNEVCIGETKFKVGKTVSRMVRKGTEIALVLATAGEIISDRSKQLFKNGDLLEGYIADVIGSVVAEKIMDRLHYTHIAGYAQKNKLQFSNRYSPGYCEWNVEEQQKLFSLLPPGFNFINLTQSSLMVPVKSVSGIVALGQEVKYHKYTCDTCSQAQCVYRNKKQAK